MIYNDKIEKVKNYIYSMNLGDIAKGSKVNEEVKSDDKIVRLSTSCSCTGVLLDENNSIIIEPKTEKTGSFMPRVSITTEKGVTYYINVKYKVV